MKTCLSLTKANARILDATAGNRVIWKTKDDSRILFIDVEPELEVKPDIVMNCTKTDFPDKSFNLIVFDPPHGFGGKVGEGFHTCRNKKEAEAFSRKWGYEKGNLAHCYYGVDKFKTRPQVLRFVYLASKEFYRILQDTGILFVKWTSYQIHLDKALPYFLRNWLEMMRLEIKDSSQTAGASQTYWLLFMKKLEVSNQSELEVAE
jgi:hypothetical protein